jgi:hypothetical protein
MTKSKLNKNEDFKLTSIKDVIGVENRVWKRNMLLNREGKISIWFNHF